MRNRSEQRYGEKSVNDDERRPKGHGVPLLRARRNGDLLYDGFA
jgi:hypothetical protein